MTVLLLVCALLTHGALKIDAADASEWLNAQNKTNMFALAQWALTLPHYLVMTLLLNFYLLDCLYAERKDRSILFWKSLPVSDGATVASKIVVACVVVPLGTFVLALVTDILFTAIWDLRAVIMHTPELLVWDTVAFLKTQALMFLGLVISILWYAPFLGCFLLASACVRRNVLMWVTVVPLLVVIFEQIAFGTHWLSNFLDYRGGRHLGGPARGGRSDHRHPQCRTRARGDRVAPGSLRPRPCRPRVYQHRPVARRRFCRRLCLRGRLGPRLPRRGLGARLVGQAPKIQGK